MQHQPQLWFDRSDVETLRRRIAQNEPTASGIWRLARALAQTPAQAVPEEAEEQYPVACAIAHLVTGERQYADKAHEFVLRWTAGWTTGELMLAHWAMVGAIVQECCCDAWDESQRIAMTQLLVKLHEGQRQVDLHVGNPHDVTNNHWAVSHAGAALAAMAAHAHPVDERGTAADMGEGMAWAMGRVRAFLMHHGDRGLYHEGLGYMAYPAAYWLPAIVAWRRFGGGDLVERFANIRQMAASLYATACARPTVPDDGGPSTSFGMKLSWNDDGLGWMQSGVNTLLIALAPREQVGALRWMYDRLSGIHSPAAKPIPPQADTPAPSFSPGFAGWFFTLLYYPYDVPAVEPTGILPLHYADSRQGIGVFRNQYRDGHDAILGCYARATFVGGHAHDDAGSIRLMALGHDWIMGGGQARPKAEYQSLVMPADGKRRQPYGLGAVIWDEAHDAGGVFGMDLRKPNIGYCERYVAVDYSGRCGAPVLLAMLDQIDDHLTRDWLWNITYEPGLRLTIDEDRRGFSLTAADGVAMLARFLGVAPASIEPKTTPDSSRTYQSGWSRTYPGRPYIQARFANRAHLGIYAVMAIGRGQVPRAELIGGLDVRVDAHEWRRPFGAAIPAAFRLGVSGGLCKYPAGIKFLEAGGRA
jgi:hypothetical protein